MKIGVRIALTTGDPGALFADARAIEAAGADSLWSDGGDAYVLLAALAATTWRTRLIASGAPNAPGRETCAWLARGRLCVAEELAEKWEHVDFPESKAAWRMRRADAEGRGIDGITLPNDERLIDLLRNPDVEDDRSDLNIAVG